MGVVVKERLQITSPKVIDYATLGVRNDFMDVYLGAMCHFCISTASGFDAIPSIFRRSVVYVNMAPAAYFLTFRKKDLTIFKHHHATVDHHELTLKEIFSYDVDRYIKTPDYLKRGVYLRENSSDEICDVVIEMLERLDGTWKIDGDDEALQQVFWEIFDAERLVDKI